MNWQPIETAPKDGTYILLNQRYLPDEPFIGYWFNRKWEADARAYDTNGDAIVISNIGGQADIDFWMPLPASPTPDKEGK